MGPTRDINQRKSNRQTATTTRSNDKEFKEVILNAVPIETAGGCMSVSLRSQACVDEI